MSGLPSCRESPFGLRGAAPVWLFGEFFRPFIRDLLLPGRAISGEVWSLVRGENDGGGRGLVEGRGIVVSVRLILLF